jgi:tRNAHis guanylyltransferase
VEEQNSGLALYVSISLLCQFLTFQSLTGSQLTTKLRLSQKYKWEKPNDKAAIDLMNACARDVILELPDIVMGYGVSDEYR